MSSARGSGDWQDIGRKLPLLTTALLSVAVFAISAIAYVEMKRALVSAAGEHVVSVSEQVASAFAQSNDRMVRDGTPLSRDSALHAMLTGSADSGLRTLAQRHLDDERAHGTQLALVELRDSLGDRVLMSGDSAASPQRLRRSRSPVAPLVVSHDTVLSDVQVPILRGKGDTVGFVRELSRVSSAQSRQLLSGLIGGKAKLLVGNATGDVWTDLDRKVEGPSTPYHPGKMSYATMADGTRWIGALAAVRGTPWVVWVARPEADVIGGAYAFLLRMMIVAVGVIVLGGIGARLLSRHVIAPLGAVTKAAEAIAAGDYSTRVNATRHDEVGRLAVVFNNMATAIQTASLELENQQTELEVQQVELEESNEQLQQTVADLTEARGAAERSHARAAAIVTGAIDGVITIDQHDRIVEFNPAAERTFGCQASEAVGRPLTELVALPVSEHGGEGSRTLGGSVADAKGRRIELAAVRADGAGFPVELAITRIPVDGSPMFTCFVRDVSERKQLEAQLRRSQKMEAIGRVTGGVAHDFNNILTVIISYTDMALADQALGDTVRADLAQVRAGADHAAALTRQLLTFSRKQVLHPTVLDLNATVGTVATMLSRVLPANIALTTNLDSTVDAVFADHGQLEQVLMNLVVNARDAMPDGGSLVVETKNEVLDDAYVALHPGGTPGRHVVLSVRDTGIGMDAQTRDRIFEPFFTTKGAGKGTGLGLATVYGIVRQSGGSIYVYSEPGLGTTFKVYLPAYAGASTDLEVPVERSLASCPTNDAATVLLVEDDATVRDVTRMVLEQLGHEVVPAPDVATALELIRGQSHRFDIVLTDAIMPGQSGMDLAEILDQEHPELPVILMSGYAEELIGGERSLAADVVFLEKPFTGPSIVRAFESVRAKVGAARGSEDWIG